MRKSKISSLKSEEQKEKPAPAEGSETEQTVEGEVSPAEEQEEKPEDK